MADTQQQATTTQTAQPATLQTLMERYGQSPRAQVHTSFDRATAPQRMSQAPRTGASMSTGDVHAEMKGIELDLAALAEQYGKLNLTFGNMIGEKKLYTFTDALRIGFYSVWNKNKAREVKIDAARRHGNCIEQLVDRMAEVLQEQYQKAVQGKEYAKNLQLENVAHMRTLDEKLIERLRSNYVGGADLTDGEKEVQKLETELRDIDDVLGGYEEKVHAAKQTGDMKQVRLLTDEMTQVLQMKYEVLDGKIGADGVVSEIRRQMLSSAEGVQSAKGAIAATKVNYVAINALIDAMSELEIKYDHARSDFVPVFKIQGKIAAAGTSALQMRDTLVQVANISQRLMAANANLVQRLSGEVFELVKTPLYDPAQAKAIEDKLSAYMTELNAQKKEWAEAQATLIAEPQAAHYAKHV